MIEFDMMHFSLSVDPVSATVNQGFSSNVVSRERGSTQDIFVRIFEVDRIHQVITKRFRSKARPWQVSVLVDITHKKRDVCTIASTNTDKSLVY